MSAAEPMRRQLIEGNWSLVRLDIHLEVFILLLLLPFKD